MRIEEGVSVNGNRYRMPRRPLAVVCVDGGDPAYFANGLARGVIPNLHRFMRQGFFAVGQGSMPSFTCPNNLSIITGVEPDVHGISGNFHLDRESGEPVMMTGPELVRCPSILAALGARGLRVATITAKDKLRRQLEKGLSPSQGHVSFSAERASEATEEENGIGSVPGWLGMAEPDVYSPELSLFVMEAGIRLLEEERVDVLYLSLTDYVQHRYPPEAPEALEFLARLDDAFGRLDALGALVAITADHGMSDKANVEGAPNVVWLQDVLDARLGAGAARVICPITDPYTAHHGALGGFVRVYLDDAAARERAAQIVRALEGVHSVWTRESACRAFDLPPDREGDLAVIAHADHAIGGRSVDHDLEGLHGQRLRTHGGLSERNVPLILSRPLNDWGLVRAAGGPLPNRALMEMALNGTD